MMGDDEKDMRTLINWITLHQANANTKLLLNYIYLMHNTYFHTVHFFLSNHSDYNDTDLLTNTTELCSLMYRTMKLFIPTLIQCMSTGGCG